MGIQRQRKVNEVLNLVNEQIGCYNATSAITLKSLLDLIESTSAANEASRQKIQDSQNTAANNVLQSKNILEENQHDLEELL
jgi:hypothetical protein